MKNRHNIPPLQRQALLAMVTDPSHALKRIPGGNYCPVNGSHPTFTCRTVNGMERDGLVDLDEPLCTTRVELTPEGLAIATQLHEAAQAQAGAA